MCAGTSGLTEPGASGETVHGEGGGMGAYEGGCVCVCVCVCAHACVDPFAFGSTNLSLALLPVSGRSRHLIFRNLFCLISESDELWFQEVFNAKNQVLRHNNVL